MFLQTGFVTGMVNISRHRYEYGAGSDQSSGEAEADRHQEASWQRQVQKQCLRTAPSGQPGDLP